jgi:prepilin-type N-terminal cleavage/methylation domain-containing protein
LNSSNRFRCHLAFTLVELLVVITIIGMLVALLLPAVSATRESARCGQCVNHMRNLAQAMMAYDASKGQLPGYSQRVPRSSTEAVGIRHGGTPPQWMLITVPRKEAAPISWVAKLMPHIDRQDLWDQIADKNVEFAIRPVSVLVCPSDRDATAVSGVPALTYNVNAGAPDFDDRFLLDPDDPNVGDTTHNALFLNLFEYAWLRMKAPATRLSDIDDGAATTIMLSENIHKSYEPYAPGYPSRFSWACGTEQHLGIVWVVSYPPQPGDTYVEQEGINRVGDDVYDNDPVFDPNRPRFARPASNHGRGVNVAFGDAHCEFLRDDIDYVVYQQLLTPNGKKSVDPRDHDAGVKPPDPSHPIQKFRAAPPLSEEDYL